jgi:cysteinyl-tRNA synthetase
LASSAQAETAIVTSDGPVAVHTWGYQLQGRGEAGLKPGVLAAAPHDLLVVEPSRFGDASSRFMPDEVRTMQRRPDGARRVVLAYVSIGEVEDFREVWRRDWTSSGKARGKLTEQAPAWLGPVNPDWPESRKVRFWDPAWRRTLVNEEKHGALDAIVAQGFDGAYLDIIDAYYFWGAEVERNDLRTGDPHDEQEAARRMAELVVALAEHARRTTPAFFLVPQNGEFILTDLREGLRPQPGDGALAKAYLDAIGAIGVEDLYHFGDDDENNPLEVDDERVAVLQEDFLNAGKPVLVVDYLDRPELVEGFVRRASRDGFLPYAAPKRGLDRLARPVKKTP